MVAPSKLVNFSCLHCKTRRNVIRAAKIVAEQKLQGAGMGWDGQYFTSHAGLPPMWPGFNSWTWRHMWVEFVVGSRPCSERFFSGYSRTPFIQSPMGPKTLAVLTGWLYYRSKFRDVRAVMTNISHSYFLDNCSVGNESREEFCLLCTVNRLFV